MRVSFRLMHFALLDRVLEQSADRILTIKQVSSAEEYLRDHFPDFPVLPGVFMVEALVQAGRRLMEHRGVNDRLVLGSVRAVKYGSFVRPGESLRIEVSFSKDLGDGVYELKGEGMVIPAGAGALEQGERQVAVSGRFTLRPVRVE